MLFVDEVQDAVTPHPDRVLTWDKFFAIAVSSHLQRVFLTGTFPPHLTDKFLRVTISNQDTLMIRATTDRPELGYHVVNINWKTSIIRNAMALVRMLETELEGKDRIIIFFQNHDTCEQFAHRYGCAKYHSKLPMFGDDCKDSNLHRWDVGETKVLVATTAAAVGVDRPYVKFTVVVEGTYGLLTFAQEVGRGGRRGEPSYAIVLRNERAHKVHAFKGLTDPKDVSCIAAFEGYLNNASNCRRHLLLKCLDGSDLCDQRRRRLTCDQVPGSNPCDMCQPRSRIALLIKSSVTEAHTDTTLPPITPTGHCSYKSAATARMPAPVAPVAGPSNREKTLSQESYGEEPTASLLGLFDAIDKLHSVRDFPTLKR